MSKKPTPPASDFVGDEHWGRGGQYVVVDGKRVPVIEPGDVIATEHVGAATGKPRTAVPGNFLESPSAEAPAEQSPAKKGN